MGLIAPAQSSYKLIREGEVMFIRPHFLCPTLPNGCVLHLALAGGMGLRQKLTSESDVGYNRSGLLVAETCISWSC